MLTWKSVNPPSVPAPVAATSSGTYLSCKFVVSTDRQEEKEIRPTPFFAKEKAISVIGPYAGKESQIDRCSTMCCFFVCPVPFVTLLADGNEGTWESPYRSIEKLATYFSVSTKATDHRHHPTTWHSYPLLLWALWPNQCLGPVSLPRVPLSRELKGLQYCR